MVVAENHRTHTVLQEILIAPTVRDILHSLTLFEWILMKLLQFFIGCKSTIDLMSEVNPVPQTCPELSLIYKY